MNQNIVDLQNQMQPQMQSLHDPKTGGIKKINPNDRLAIPIFHLPNFRTNFAIQNGCERNLIFRTWGGLGDQICAEPTLRFALKTFTKDGCDVSLASEKPELFKHLKFKKVFDLNEVIPNYLKYLCFETITPPNDTNLVWQFFSHMLVNCVDFPSLCAIRSMLPIQDKEILISSDASSHSIAATEYYAIKMKAAPLCHVVLVHPGRHWPSKTFPIYWWDSILKGLRDNNVTPIIIGANTDDNRGTVDVNTEGCIDLRNKTSVSEITWLCQNADVVLTNDSSPLHMAASRDPQLSTSGTWIGYVATAKHPDFITHWRMNEHGVLEWQWREHNFGKGGIWDIISMCPNAEQEVTADKVDLDILKSWLPDPEEVIDWTMDKLDG